MNSIQVVAGALASLLSFNLLPPAPMTEFTAAIAAARSLTVLDSALTKACRVAADTEVVGTPPVVLAPLVVVAPAVVVAPEFGCMSIQIWHFLKLQS